MYVRCRKPLFLLYFHQVRYEYSDQSSVHNRLRYEHSVFYVSDYSNKAKCAFDFLILEELCE